MQYRQLGSSDLKVSVIGFGNMSWPWCHFGQQAPPDTVFDTEAIRNMVATALDSGINFFDTAEGYGRGKGEELLGNAFKELGRRNEATIATKVGPLFGEEQVNGRGCNLSSKHIRQRCEQSLRRLQTETIDLYYAHWPDAHTPIEDTCEIMSRLRDEGKIRAFAVSNFDPQQLGSALHLMPVAANQRPYSLIDRRIDQEVLPFCKKNQVGIVAYSPLGKGMLSGKYDADHLPPQEDYRHQRPHFSPENVAANTGLAARLREMASDLGTTAAGVALAWVLARPGVAAVIPGAKTPAQIRDNAAAGALQLPPEFIDELDQRSLSLPSAQR